MAASDIGQLFLNGLVLTSCYALFAVGLSLVFGVMKIINFAHGELYMVGAYIVWLVISAGSNFLSLVPLFFLGLVAALLVVGGLGIAIERGIFRPLRVSPLAGFMASLGILYIMRVSVGQIFGMRSKVVAAIFPGTLEFAGSKLPVHMAVAILAAAILIGFLWFFLGQTKLGRGIRASSQDSVAAAIQGISLSRMSALAMGIGSALAAAAGGLVGIAFVITPYIGWGVLWKAFIIVIVGGMGSIGGAIVASFLFGFLDSLVTSLGEPQLVIMVDVLIMLLILAFKPQGLMGREK